MYKKAYESTRAAYQRSAHKYVRKTQNAASSARERFISQLPKHARVLDLGCAGGRDCEVMAAYGLRVSGVDVVDAFVKIARDRVLEADIRNMDMRSLTFEKQSFDAIWANASLLHIAKKDVPTVLTQLHRIMRRDGLLYILVKQGRGEELRDDGRFFSYFEPVELMQYVELAGFEVKGSENAPDYKDRPDVNWLQVWATKDSGSDYTR